jgi:NADPH2:quinone reductase
MPFPTKAAVLTKLGDPEVFEIREINLPWPGNNDDVLVRIEAAGVNPADTFFRALGPYIGDGPGAVLGHDGAGIVEAIGDAVTTVKPGDRVCFCNGGVGGDPGTYAYHAVVPEGLLARVPDSVDMATAAAIPLVFITAWEALVERAQLKSGETVLVHGGAGGTGQITTQIARELGARVATTVSNDEKAALSKSLGAEIAIDYTDNDFVKVIHQWTDGKGVNVGFDNAGPEIFKRTLSAMAPYGRLVTLMGMPGDLEDESAYNKNLSIHNVMMLTPMWQGLSAERSRQAEIVRQAMSWLENGRIKINLVDSYALENVAEAHRQLENGGMLGKVVLTMD